MLCLRCNPNSNPNPCIASKCPGMTKKLYARLNLCLILDLKYFKNFFFFNSKACENVCKVLGKHVYQFLIYRLYWHYPANVCMSDPCLIGLNFDMNIIGVNKNVEIIGMKWSPLIVLQFWYYLEDWVKSWFTKDNTLFPLSDGKFELETWEMNKFSVPRSWCGQKCSMSCWIYHLALQRPI